MRRASTMRASEGVISGRSASLRPERSSMLYSCDVTSSPALRTIGLGLGLGLGLGVPREDLLLAEAVEPVEVEVGQPQP